MAWHIRLFDYGKNTKQMAKIQCTYCCTVQHALYSLWTPLFAVGGENHSNSNNNNKTMSRTITEPSIYHFKKFACQKYIVLKGGKMLLLSLLVFYRQCKHSFVTASFSPIVLCCQCCAFQNWFKWLFSLPLLLIASEEREEATGKVL